MALAACSKGGSTGPLNKLAFQDPNSLLFFDRLKYQRTTGRFCDVSLTVNKTVFRAHRLVLAAYSPYFDSIFRYNRITKEKVVVNFDNPELFGAILDYMYSGHIVIDRTSVVELLKIVRLKHYCSEYLERNLDASNCLTVKNLAKNYGFQKVLNKAQDFFERNIDTVLNQNLDVLTLTFKELSSLLLSYKNCIQSDTFFNVIVRWTNHDLEKREEYFGNLLKNLNVHQLSMQKLESMMDFNPFFSQSRRSLYSVLNMLKLDNALAERYVEEYVSLEQQFGNTTYEEVYEAGNGASSGSEASAISDEDAIEHDGEHESADQRHSLKLKLSLAGPKKRSRPRGPDEPRRKRGRPPLIRPPPLDLDPSVDEEPEARFYHFDDEDDTVAVFGEADDLNPEDVAGLDASAEEEEQEENADSAELTCEHCSFHARSRARLKRHAAAHALNVLYVCNICQFECRWNRAFYDHMRQHFQTLPFECDFCPYTADRMHVLLSHRLTHTNEKPYKCVNCTFRTRVHGNLINHHRVHSGEKPFQCETCGKRFAMKSTLTQHMAAHSDNRPFACEQCVFTTKYQSHLISHRRLHTGDLFRCQEPNCTYVSPKKSQLAAHLRTHLAMRPHQCKTCNRSFIERSHLVRHERIHLTVKPFTCDLCQYASSRRDKLKEHVLKHHNGQGRMKQYRHRTKRPKEMGDLPSKTQVPHQNPNALFAPIQDREYERREHCNSLPMTGYDDDLDELALPMSAGIIDNNHVHHHRQHSVPIDFCHSQEMSLVGDASTSQMMQPTQQQQHQQQQQQQQAQHMNDQLMFDMHAGRSFSNAPMHNNAGFSNQLPSSSMSCHNYPIDFIPNRQMDPHQQQQSALMQQDIRSNIGYHEYLDMHPNNAIMVERPMSQPNLRYCSMEPLGNEAPHSSQPHHSQAMDQTSDWYPS